VQIDCLLTWKRPIGQQFLQPVPLVVENVLLIERLALSLASVFRAASLVLLAFAALRCASRAVRN
jgi:hypothetical protein